MAAASDRCPNCGEPVAPDDFQCVQCELLLNAAVTEENEVPDEAPEPSIVRAILAQPSRKPTNELPLPRAPLPQALGDEHLAATDPFRPIAGPHLVPRIVAPLHEVAGRLHDFEAYVASFVDGVRPPNEIARQAKLSEVEVHAIVRALKDRRVLELVPKVTAAPPAPPPLVTPADRPPLPIAARPAPAPVRAPPPAPAPPPPTRAAPMKRAPLEAPVAQAESEENVLQRAVNLERSGQPDGAIYVLKRGISRVKNPGPLYNRLALILISQRRDYGEAEELLKKALEVEPNNAVYQQNLYKVVGLAAAQRESGKSKVGGLFARLRRK